MYMSDPTTGASVIVPTYKEAPNLEPLTQRTFAALADAGFPVELLIVDDDSRDGTDEVVRKLAERFPVRLIVRTGERGLSGAVLRGFKEAAYDRFVVMDADLQHPPETIPQLLQQLDQPGCDFAIATRYAGGVIGTDWPWLRKVGSKVATLMARPLTPVSDPLSGFFALRRETWKNAVGVSPIGYKIALELMVKAGCRNPREVPIEFAARTAGSSKLGAGVFWKYLVHLMRLYRFRFAAGFGRG